MKNLFLLLVISTLLSCSGDKKTYVLIETEFGNMKVELYDSTPLHQENFVKLANEGFYDGLLFHRVIPNFMIQGGDPVSKDAPPGQPLGAGGPGYKIPAEIGAPHYRGVLAAARQGGALNPEKQSSGSQFYIVQGTKVSEGLLSNIEKRMGFQYNEVQRAKYLEVGGSPNLDGDYTAFGEVVDGLDVIDKIAAMETDPRDRPVQNIQMKIRNL